jgi:hypothetical protein
MRVCLFYSSPLQAKKAFVHEIAGPCCGDQADSAPSNEIARRRAENGTLK